MYGAGRPGYRVELGFNHLQNEPYNPETHCISVKDVVPNSPAERAGLRPGDRIIAINGSMLETFAPYDTAYSDAKPGDAVALMVARPGEPQPILLHGVFRSAADAAPEGLAKSSAQQLTRFYPVLFLLVGFAVLFLRLQDFHAWMLALLFCAFIATPSFNSSLMAIPRPFHSFVSVYQILFAGMLCPLFYVFFALFPTRSPLERRLPWIKWLALAFGLSLVLPGFWFGDMRSPGIAARLLGDQHGGLTRQIFVFGSYFLIALGLLSLLGNAMARGADPEPPRKSRVILWGTIFGVLPIVIERFIVDSTGYRPSFWMDFVFIFVLLLYPLSFGYAVVKYRVMDIPVLLRRSARYVLVQRGFLVLLFVVAAAAIALFTRTFARFFPEGTNLGMTLSAVFGIALVWVSAPVVKRGTERIDRAFFRSAYDARVILQNLAEKTRTVTGRGELASLLALQIRGALHPKAFACYLQAADGNLVADFGHSPVDPATLPDGLPRPRFPSRFGAVFVLQDRNVLSPTVPMLAELAQRGRAWDVPPPIASELAAGSFVPECLVPILGRNSGLIGLIVLGPRLSEEPYSGEDKHLLDSVAAQAGITLENIRFAEEMADRLEAERSAAMEMDIARRVQARLFPQKLPPLQTLEYVGGCVQARQVGGDYYDFLDMGSGVVGLVLADISGKGMSGALLMANLQANLRSQYAVALDDLPRLLQSVNRLFYENSTDESYATMFFGIYDDSSRRLRYANCGHVPPVLVHPDGSVQRLQSTTTVLGLFAEWDCPIEEVQLHPGDVMAVCTDGVTEAPDAQGEEYGAQRLAAFLAQNRASSANDLLAAIQSSVQQFSPAAQADDITLIVARCR